MITQRFGFTKNFTKERNNRVYSRLNKILCGFKEQVRIRSSGEKCGLDQLRQHETEFAATVSGSSDQRAQAFLQKLKTNSRITPQLALEIYRNNTRGARIAALEMIYPACVHILGKAVFRSIAREYATKDSYGSADLNTYGASFDQHLQRLLATGRLQNDYRYLADLAGLEYLVHAAYYADDDPLFDFDDFEQAINNGCDIYLLPSHALGLIASEYPLRQIWNSNLNQHDCEQVFEINETQYLVVHRDENQPAVTPAEHDTYRLLVAINEAWSLQQLIDHSDYAIDRLLPDLIARHWIVGINKHG